MENSKIRRVSWDILRNNFLDYIKGGVPYIVFNLVVLGSMMALMISMISRLIKGTSIDWLGFTFTIVGFVLVMMIAAFLLVFGYMLFLLRMVRHGEKDMRNALLGFSREGVRYMGVALLIWLIMSGAFILIEYVAGEVNLDIVGTLAVSAVSMLISLVVWVLPFLIHDHPELSVGALIKKAWQVMDGEKMRYFRLQLSVILLALAVLLVLGLVAALLFIPAYQRGVLDIGSMVVPGSILYLLFVLASLLLNFYALTLSVVFYETRIASYSSGEEGTFLDKTEY